LFGALFKQRAENGTLFKQREARCLQTETTKRALFAKFALMHDII